MNASGSDLVVIGGGAAGFFGAIQCAERDPDARIIILEKSEKVLTKVKISGGGRCNVTHACFDPSEMVQYYPRGEKELLGPFNRFLSGDMMAWLDDHGVETKIEDDGRVFPVSDDSQTIIDCFTGTAQKLSISLRTGCAVTGLQPSADGWIIHTGEEDIVARRVLIATGSNPAIWRMLEAMDIAIIPPVPSLFTFNIQHHLLQDLMGVSLPHVTLTLKLDKPVFTEGPMLITHWGLSGPAVLKASAIAARELHDMEYRFHIAINWTGQEKNAVLQWIDTQRSTHGNRQCQQQTAFDIPKRLWERLHLAAGTSGKNWADLRTRDIDLLAGVLCGTILPVNGKSTFKDEFVTAGGVDTCDIQFTTMEHKQFPGLHFAGEVLNIDAVTGGFNFQAAWTTAYIAAEAMAGKLTQV